MAKDKIEWDLDILRKIVGRKDPKGKAKHTVKHRDRTKYKRKPKHVHNQTQDQG